MKYAVIKLGGHQYLVREGQSLDVQRLPGEEGKMFEVKEVFLTFEDEGKNVQIGNPFLGNVLVSIKKEDEWKDKKVMVVKFKRKVRYHKRVGHRQWKNTVSVTKIAA